MWNEIYSYWNRLYFVYMLHPYIQYGLTFCSLWFDQLCQAKSKGHFLSFYYSFKILLIEFNCFKRRHSFKYFFWIVNTFSCLHYNYKHIYQLMSYADFKTETCQYLDVTTLNSRSFNGSNRKIFNFEVSLNNT